MFAIRGDAGSGRYPTEEDLAEESAADPWPSDAEMERLGADELARWAAEEDTEGGQPIPPGLEEWLPGPFLAAVLAAVDAEKLPPHDLVPVLQAQSRMVSHFQAAYYSTVAEIGSCVPTGPEGIPERSTEWFEFANMELSAALTLTRRTADSELGIAHQLVEYPRVWLALSTGRIDVRKARVILNAVETLDVATADQVIEQVLEQAAEWTTGQLRSRLARIIIQTNPEAAEHKLKSGLDQRRVITELNPDGTANTLGLNMTPDRVAQAHTHINQVAHQIKNNGDDRAIDQIRADTYLDLLCGTPLPDSASGGGSTHITADLTTLVGLSQTPGELDGYGPLIADLTRQALKQRSQQDTQWTWCVTDTQNGTTYTGTTRRRPTSTQKRRIRSRHRTCVFPGCRMPAIDCDIDHTLAHTNGGPTTDCNLAPLCRYHHRGKHNGWKLQKHRHGHQWTSPLGHTYTNRDPPAS